MTQAEDTLDFPLLGPFFSHRAIERAITGSRYDKKRFAAILSKHGKYRERYLRLLYFLQLELERAWDDAAETGYVDIRSMKPFLKLTTHRVFIEDGKKNLSRDDISLGYHWATVLEDVYQQLSAHFLHVYHYLRQQGLSHEVKAIPVLEIWKKTPAYLSCQRTNNCLLAWFASINIPESQAAA